MHQSINWFKPYLGEAAINLKVQNDKSRSMKLNLAMLKTKIKVIWDYESCKIKALKYFV